jgi:hypothetical protein
MNDLPEVCASLEMENEDEPLVVISSLLNIKPSLCSTLYLILLSMYEFINGVNAIFRSAFNSSISTSGVAVCSVFIVSLIVSFCGCVCC